MDLAGSSIICSACILLPQNETEPAFAKFSNALSISVEDVFPLLPSDALGRGMIAVSMVGRFDISTSWGRRAGDEGALVAEFVVATGTGRQVVTAEAVPWTYPRDYLNLRITSSPNPCRYSTHADKLSGKL